MSESIVEMAPAAAVNDEWKSINELSDEDQGRAVALFTDEERARIADYQFSPFEKRLIRRVHPSLVKDRVEPRRSSLDWAEPEAAAAEGSRVVEMAVGLLDPSPLNPRKRFGEAGLLDLSRNLKAIGIVQALVVRPAGDRYEVVAGHRRLKAAVIAELASVPVVIRRMTDTQALEVMLSENLQREDLNPIEEAEALKAMLSLSDEKGERLYTLETLGQKIGKSAGHLSWSLTLLKLPAKARDSLEAGEITAKVAYEIAVLPTADLRTRFGAEVLRGFQGAPLTAAEAKDWRRRNYMVELRGAPFALKEAGLVPVKIKDGERVAGGACTDCPWNSANGSEEGASKLPLCTNPTCFAAKVSAHVQRVKDAALAKGMLVVEGEKTKRYLYHDGTPHNDSGMVRVDQVPLAGEVSGQRTAPKWGAMLAGEVRPQLTLVIDEKGRAFEMVERKLAIAAARKNGFVDLFPEPDARGRSGTPVESAELKAQSTKEKEAEQAREAAEKLRVKVEARAAVLGLEALCVEISRAGLTPAAWGALVEVALFHVGGDGAMFVCQRRKLDDGEAREKLLRAHAAGLPPERLPSLVVELLLAGWMRYAGIEAKGFAVLSAAYGIAAADLRTAAKAALGMTAEKKGRAKKAKPEREEPTVRERILRLAEPRGMSVSCLNVVASRVIGKPWAEKPFETAAGGELKAILAAVDDLTNYDPAEGWVPLGASIVCPLCGELGPKVSPDLPPRLACSPACGYEGVVPREEAAEDEEGDAPSAHALTPLPPGMRWESWPPHGVFTVNEHGVFENAAELVLEMPKKPRLSVSLECAEKEGKWYSASHYQAPWEGSGGPVFFGGDAPAYADQWSALLAAGVGLLERLRKISGLSAAVKRMEGHLLAMEALVPPAEGGAA